MSSMEELPTHISIRGRYILHRRIGSGSFGDIYIGLHLDSNQPVAIKLENKYTNPSQLVSECKIYRMLGKAVGIPRVYMFFTENDYNIMIFELLGPSIEDLFVFCQNQFSLKTVLMLADQLIHRLQHVHRSHFVHRDVKPSNFLMGCDRNINTVYIVDFGLARFFRDPNTHHHIPFTCGRQLSGTPRYASISTHLGFQQTRRDDMISLGYVLIYFLLGSLPWQGFGLKHPEEKYSIILNKKAIKAEELTQSLPREFATYLDYCYCLKFEEAPDYRYLRTLFRNLFYKSGYAYDFQWDWMTANKTLTKQTVKVSLPPLKN